MNARQSRPFIIKALRHCSKYKITDLNGIADQIIEEVATFEEAIADGGVMLGIGGGQAAADIRQTIQQQPPLSNSPIITTGLSAPIPETMPDIFRRVNAEVPVVEQYSEQELQDMKTSAVKNYQAELPAKIQITLDGASEPTTLLRHTVSSSPQWMTTIHIAYVPNGATSEAQMIKCMYDIMKPLPSVATVTTAIKDGARMLLSAAPRQVMSMIPPRPNGALIDDSALKGDDMEGHADAQLFSKMLADNGSVDSIMAKLNKG